MSEAEEGRAAKVSDHQCSMCGRVTEDWSEREGPTKGKQRKDSEDRCADYRAWRHRLGDGCYVMDIDQIEWRLVDGLPVPVAALELSRVDGNKRLPQSYLNAVTTRFQDRDGQASAITAFAAKMGVKAWVVLFRWDLTDFWVYNLTDTRGWWHMDKPRYTSWVKGMGARRSEEEEPNDGSV